MNEKNFDSISQFEVPQIWLENALDIPQNHVKKPIPLIKLSRILVAAMCFVLVCGISVALYFSTDDSSIPPVKSPTQAYSDSSESISHKNPAESTEKSQDDKKEKNKDKKEDPTQNSHPERSEDETENTQNPQKPQDKPSHKPQKPTTDKTENNDKTEPTESLRDPTKPEDVFPPPWDPTESTESDIYPPAPDTECPTESQDNPPYSPTETPVIDYNTRIRADIFLNRLTGSQNVYCKVYSPDGVLMGDSNLFSSSHLAQKEFQTDTYVRVCYYPYRSLDIRKSGDYKIIFYNESGEQLYREIRHLTAEY